MKAWVKILYAEFRKEDYEFEVLVSRYPERTKRDMIRVFEKGGATPDSIARCLPFRDVMGKRFSSFEELFELDVRGFDYKVLIGKSKENEQMGIEDFIGFEPVVIK